jgi:signal transduction histidine kinase/CheY-like chemotaxis protein
MIVLLSLLSVSVFAKPLVLGADQAVADIGASSEYYCTTDLSVDFAEAQTAKYQRWVGGTINFGRRPGACWIRFNIVNTNQQAGSYILSSRFAYIDFIDLYYQEDAGFKHQGLGVGLALNERPFQSNVLMYRLHFDAGEEKTIYLRVESESLLIAPISIAAEDVFIADTILSQWLDGLYYGSLLSLLLIAALLFYYFKDVAYIYYAGQLLSILVVFLNIDGMTSYLLGDAVFLINYLHIVFSYLAILMLMLFASEFLRLDEIPLFKLSTRLIVFLCLAGIALVLILPVRLSIYGTSFSSIAFAAFLIYGSVYRLREGMEEAKYFMLGWAVLLICIVIISVVSAFGISADMAVLIEFIKYSYLAQQIIFSLGLSIRIRMLKNKEEQASIEAIKMSSAMKIKNELFAKMSHEIRTPMTGVLGLLDLLKDTKLNEKQSVYVDTASSSAATLLSVINDVLDYSKIEAGKMVLAVSSFDIKQTLHESLDTFSVLSKNKGLNQHLQIADDFPDYITGDEIRLRQVLLNLLSNAVKFTESGSITVKAEIERVLGEHEVMLCIRICDTGVGMSNELIEKMFQPYEQAEAKFTGQYQGTGLGLSICAQLVELMHGEISVSSQLGVGSSISLCFPTSVKQSLLEEKNMQSTEALPDLNGVRVLVAEDNAVNRLVLDGMLAKLNIHCEFANNGQQAFEAYCKHHSSYDLILMDCEMPEVNGIVATEMIREYEQQQGLSAMPIVALTAQTSEQAVQQSLQAGMNNHLSKPVQLAVLASVIAELCKQE